VLVLFSFFAAADDVLVLLFFFLSVADDVFMLFLWFLEDVVLGNAGKTILVCIGSQTGTRLLSVDADCVFFLFFGGPLHCNRLC
jgi:hypothetical protein